MNEERHVNSFSRGIWYVIIPIVINCGEKPTCLRVG